MLPPVCAPLFLLPLLAPAAPQEAPDLLPAPSAAAERGAGAVLPGGRILAVNPLLRPAAQALEADLPRVGVRRGQGVPVVLQTREDLDGEFLVEVDAESVRVTGRDPAAAARTARWLLQWVGAGGGRAPFLRWQAQPARARRALALEDSGPAPPEAGLERLLQLLSLHLATDLYLGLEEPPKERPRAWRLLERRYGVALHAGAAPEGLALVARLPREAAAGPGPAFEEERLRLPGLLAAAFAGKAPEEAPVLTPARGTDRLLRRLLAARRPGPLRVRVEAAGAGSVRLTWEPSPDEPLAYRVESVDPARPSRAQLLAELPPDLRSWEGPWPGEGRVLRVRARNPLGLGAPGALLHPPEG